MASRNPAKYFIKRDVQDLLIKLTGCDLKRIFRPGFNPKQLNSNMELLTDAQLEEEKRKTLDKARNYLQMPPFLPARNTSTQILSTDERLNPLNLTKSDYFFTDISLNKPDKKRMVVVREANGVLRKASDLEREKMFQVYFPKEGKPNHMPSMFNQTNLEECLKMKHYLLLLNKACLIFEPNDPEYIRVSHRVYDYINETREYDALYSTRFYGPMIFYLCWYKKLDNLIAYYIENSSLTDCVRVINLYLLLNDIDIQTINNINGKSELDIIKVFLEKYLNSSVNAVQAFRKHSETEKQQKCSN